MAQGITWSTATVLEETAAQLRGCGLNVALLDTLPKLLDIDTAEVWPRCLLPVQYGVWENKYIISC